MYGLFFLCPHSHTFIPVRVELLRWAIKCQDGLSRVKEGRDGEVVERANMSCRGCKLMCWGGELRNRGYAKCVWNMAAAR